MLNDSYTNTQINLFDAITDEEYDQCKETLVDFTTSQIGKGLQDLRDRHDLSQVKLAERIKATGFALSDKSISKLENGKIKKRARVIVYTVIILKHFNQDISSFKSSVILSDKSR